jgi:hypothetical protein
MIIANMAKDLNTTGIAPQAEFIIVTTPELLVNTPVILEIALVA